MEFIPPTPEDEGGFGPEWVEAVAKEYLVEKEREAEAMAKFGEDDEEEEKDEGDEKSVRVVAVTKAAKNEVQGILSTTYVVDFDYEVFSGDDEWEKREGSIFVKVPLRDQPQFASVNVREAAMLKEVLPKLKEFLDSRCQGFFKLPMPRLIHCHYDGSGVRDVFVLENLLSDGYYNFTNESCLNREHMEAVLDSLAYLHGTGLAYRHSTGEGRLEDLQSAFPSLETQLQLRDLIESPNLRDHFRRHFRPFLHYLEEEEPELAKHTGYMRKMHKHILKIIERLETCGFERLITLAHGDAKPNNFLFRRIEIDLEGLECEGIEPILVDWQGGFLGSAANDLMWALFPFLEHSRGLLPTAMEYYYDQLCNVFETFGVSPTELGLPESDFPAFSSLLKRCLVLEFLTVTVVKPVMSVSQPEKLRRWHKETAKNQRRRFKKAVERPEVEEVFRSTRFTGFCSLYFRIATSLGAFQELGSLYFDVMRDSMFDDPNKKMDDHDSDMEDDTDLFSRVINAPSKDIVRAAGVAAAAVGVAAGAYLCVEHKIYERYLTKLVVPYCFQG